MRELAPRVFIEDSYEGVTLGAINWSHGLIFIDAPIIPDDVRSWRAALLNMGGGITPLLINLDSHLDRTMGVRQMDCTIVAHEKVGDVFRDRPVSLKSQASDTGAEWELQEGISSVRWSPPEITFTESLQVNSTEPYIWIEYHPGPSAGASWVRIPEEHVVFIGDAVVAGEPPFFADSDIPTWVETLKILTTDEYRDYIIISSRSGVLNTSHVWDQINFLEYVNKKLERLSAEFHYEEEIDNLVLDLMQQIGSSLKTHKQRLHYGLVNYYRKHYIPEPKVE